MKSQGWAAIAVIGAALVISGCGAQGAAQNFLGSHLACPIDIYSDAQWTPDGSQILYTHVGPQSADLRVMSSLGKNDQLLVRNVFMPLISPDGTLVLFQRLRSDFQTHDYFILDLATRQARRVAELGEGAAWSPDSRSFIYASIPDTSQPVTSWQLHKVDVQTGAVTDLTDGAAAPHSATSRAFWSPDGATIAYPVLTSADGYQVMLLPVGGAASELSVPGISACTTAAVDNGVQPMGWIPATGQLVIEHSCPTRLELFVVTQNGQTASLTALKADTWDIAWSPDGQQELFTAYTNRNELTIADWDGANARLLRADAAQGRWSPDGQTIVFTGADSAGLPEIFTIKPDGTALAQLTQNQGGAMTCPH